MTFEGGNAPTKNPEQIRESGFEALKARLSSHEGRFRLVPSNPAAGQVTQAEYRLCDPDPDPETDMASAAVFIGVTHDGLTREQFIETMTADDEDEESTQEVGHARERASRTLDNLLALGLLAERNGAIELNMDLR